MEHSKVEAVCDLRSYLKTSFERMQQREKEVAHDDLSHHVATCAAQRDTMERDDTHHQKAKIETDDPEATRAWLLRQVKENIEQLWMYKARLDRQNVACVEAGKDDISSFFFLPSCASNTTSNSSAFSSTLTPRGIARRLKILDIVHANLLTGTTSTKRYFVS